MRRIPTWLRTTALIPVLAAVLAAQTTSQDEGAPVTRAEYEQLLKQLQDLQTQLTGLQQPADRERGFAQAIESLRSRVDRNEAAVDAPGTSKLMVTGFGQAGFENTSGENSSFYSQVNPLFLWELSDKVMFEAELELSLDDNETESELGFANISYLLNDNMALSVGKFLTPLSQFSRNLHPSWINKLPDAPRYAQHGGIVPSTSVGAQLSGAVAVADDGSKIDYAAWVSNGPRLETEGEHAGSQEFDNFDDTNNSKAVGGRIGYSPTASLSFGVGAMASRVNESDTNTGTLNSIIKVVDFTFIQPVESLGGRIDIRGEHVESDVNNPDVPYLDDAGLPIARFNNSRQGGYLQAAFRPTEADSDVLRNLEFITRYDYMRGPSRGNVIDRNGYTFGIDYWMTENTVGKLAFRIDDAKNTSNANSVMFQLATGF